MSAPTGESQNVTGSSSAMVVSGPMPGSTPIAVPTTQPKKQSSRLLSVSATPKPVAICETKSNISEHGGPQGERDPQGENEQAGGHDDDGAGEREQRQQPRR